jgi:hypothetical protein
MITEFASLAFKPSDSEFDEVRERGRGSLQGWNEKSAGNIAAVVWKPEKRQARAQAVGMLLQTSTGAQMSKGNAGVSKAGGLD